MDGRRHASKRSQDVDQHVARQVLAGDDPDVLLPRLEIAGLTQLARAVQERQRVRQEPLPLRGQDGRPPRAAGLAVQLDAELRLQRHEPVADALFRDGEGARRGPNLPLAGQLHECRDLIGAEVRQGRHGRTYIDEGYDFNN